MAGELSKNEVFQCTTLEISFGRIPIDFQDVTHPCRRYWVFVMSREVERTAYRAAGSPPAQLSLFPQRQPFHHKASCQVSDCSTLCALTVSGM